MTVSFHLCQPGGGASCGACCGLYNFRDHTRVALTEQLAMQTERLHRVPWEASAWQEAARELIAARRAAPMFPAVRVCPLLGFLDKDRKQVGCLGHPLVTGGTDLRDCGVYRASVCETFTCPSFGWLTDAQARLVQVACADWYLYGLVITDVEFVRGCLRLIEWELGGPAKPEVLVERPEVLAAVRKLFALKETAPRRDAKATVFGRFSRDTEGEPVPRTVDYVKLGTRAAPEDDVVLCLGYTPQDSTELMAARELVRSHVKGVARLLAG
ncbi:hypothetical protein JY651_35530 [Pyxidicoccus parkwayensis]|uniref:YkgJ family cysteine cluster protein n=1 Tax=Pyxidicoccus parkwayensis TaxID=2813578 RepID=A0ABX7NNT4_9BACT|nr:hypothetical protein [Pyxidicoccus parkwaysis]QSQ20520.1 hypothetical protein JY651_35530 [Pyxidicoccus parkwaysis]